MTFTVTTSGVPAPALAMTGDLPKGITFADKGDGTATISGRLAAGAGGVYPVTLTATNAFGTGTQAFAFNVRKAPSFTTPSRLPDASSGTAYSTTIRASGAPAPAITLTGGALPDGLTLTDNGDGTATIAGTPAAGSGKAYSFTLSAKSEAGTASRTFRLAVRQLPVVTAEDVTLTRGTAATVVVTITGNPTSRYSVTGALPQGMRLRRASGQATISGTPTRVGTYPLTVTARSSAGTTTKQFTITVE
jgi:PKD repeat protein